MPAWELVPCLVRLRWELDRIAPGRDRATDGAIGDANHSSTSDHTPDEISDALRGKDADSRNEVHAVDLDVDLRTADLSMEEVVQHILGRCRSGAEKRLRYIIFNHRIWSASSGWRQQAYTGPSPHTGHAHFSASYDTAHEASTASWYLEDLMALSADDKTWLASTIEQRAYAAVREIFADGYRAAIGQAGGPSVEDRARRNIRDYIRAITGGPGQDVDEQAVAAAVLAGLDPARIAAAIPADLADRVADELRDRLAS